MAQEVAVVDREEPFERVGRLLEIARGKGARHERRGAIADHPADPLLGQRRRAAVDEHCVRGIGKITPRVDQRAVQIEDDEFERRRHAVGFGVNDV